MSLRPLFAVLLLALVMACANRPPAPIVDHSRPGSPRLDTRYVVLRGDTLYAIAFRYGLDYRRFAASNDIPPPYRIFPGQVLRLAEADPAGSAGRTTAATGAPTARRDEPATESVRVGSAATVARPVAPLPSASAPAGVPQGAATPPSKPPLTAPVVARPAAPTGAEDNQVVTRWLWPAQGKLTRRFDENLHKGIDIGGGRGDPIVATAAGRVAYAGSGIAGYGLMLIVRHNDEYLSAYGHNDSLLVEEGDLVTVGQRIAQRGSSGTDTVKLHFEIRRRGRPVDPLSLLPPR